MFDFDSSKVSVGIRLAMLYRYKTWHVTINERPYNGLVYVVKGRFTYTFGDNSLSLKSGDVLYLPANSLPYTYTLECDDGKPPEAMQVEFEIKDCDKGKTLSFAKNPTRLKFLEGSAIKYCMSAIVAAYPSPSSSSKYECVSELYRIFALCEKDEVTGFNKTASRNISPALKFLENNYNKKIGCEELAEMCGISQSQLRRDFKTVYGISPMQYKRNIVCRMAKRLIKAGEFKVGEIADMLGFGDIYEFSHFFTKETGISPKEYYKKHG